MNADTPAGMMNEFASETTNHLLMISYFQMNQEKL